MPGDYNLLINQFELEEDQTVEPFILCSMAGDYGMVKMVFEIAWRPRFE